MKKLRVLDLFSGIGGFSLGLERTGGFETVAFCEIEDFPRIMLAKHWPAVPIHEDIRQLRGSDIGPVDVICGGYPCQPFSVAGQRQGEADDRHLWPEMYRLVDELRPTWVIGENVAGHVSMGLDGVLSDLEAIGYTCRTFIIPACAVDARHRRDRCWIVAHSDNRRQRKQGICKEQQKRAEIVCASENMADATFVMLNGIGPAGSPRRGQLANRCEWQPEPDVGRVAHGVPDRVHRLKALGNAVVPQIVKMIGHAILEAQNQSARRTALQFNKED